VVFQCVNCTNYSETIIIRLLSSLEQSMDIGIRANEETGEVNTWMNEEKYNLDR